MNKVLKHIVILSLMVIFNLSIIGLSISYNKNSNNDRHNVSVIQNTKYSYEKVSNSCNDKQIDKNKKKSSVNSYENQEKTIGEMTLSASYYGDLSENMSFDNETIIPVLNHKLLIQEIITENFINTINPKIENYYNSIEKHYNSKIKNPNKYLSFAKTVINYISESYNYLLK